MDLLDRIKLSHESLNKRTRSKLDSRGLVSDNEDALQRRLGNRHIQLLAIGGTIGTALFVTIGSGLAAGGPGSLFLAYAVYSCMLGLVNNCLAEMTVFMPVSGGFIRLAGAWVDDALGFAAGWNYFLYEAFLIPFEITALCDVLKFWRDDIPCAAVIGTTIVLYAVINVLVVKRYGEAEFWLSSGKIFLVILLFAFTLVTMCGGNPHQDAFGFRYWRQPGAFAEHLATGDLGRFEGFLACLWSACFCVVGPEYCSIAAAESKHPRIYVKNAFKVMYWRFGIIFGVGALAVGVLVPYNDNRLLNVIGNEKIAITALASPYVIAMQNLGIRGLPHVVNALLITSIFSAGNTYTYCATRGLYSLALDGRAPQIFRICTKNGVPIVCFMAVMVFPCLAFLQLTHGSGRVLVWLSNLTTSGGLLNYVIITITYIYFHQACRAQGIDRNSLPYMGWYQPGCAYVGLVWMTIMVTCCGYPSLRKWDAELFFTRYTMLLLAPVAFIFWKVLKRTCVVTSLAADLVWERPVIDIYESTTSDLPIGFWREVFQLVGLTRLWDIVARRLGVPDSVPLHKHVSSTATKGVALPRASEEWPYPPVSSDDIAPVKTVRTFDRASSP